MADNNKPEKLGFVRLYNALLPLAAVDVQDGNALKGIGLKRHEIQVEYICHYCWEASLLLVSRRIDGAPDGWLELDDTRARITSFPCATETAAVDRIVRVRSELWSQCDELVSAAIARHEPLHAKRYSANGEVIEAPTPVRHIKRATIRGQHE